MGNYSVPESIRRQKPTRGTMVKNISGYYYVYEYKSAKGDNGKRRTQMGKLIGSIKPGIGFIPNSSFLCDSEISTLEFASALYPSNENSYAFKLVIMQHHN